MNPEDLKYAQTHEWVKIEGELAIIGITEYAAHQLGDIVFLELPKTGKKLAKGDAFGVVESVKSASDLYSPVSGEIKEVNEGLPENLKAISDSPFKDGWMIKVKMGNPDDLKDLLSAKDYEKSIQGEEK